MLFGASLESVTGGGLTSTEQSPSTITIHDNLQSTSYFLSFLASKEGMGVQSSVNYFTTMHISIIHNTMEGRQSNTYT